MKVNVSKAPQGAVLLFATAGANIGTFVLGTLPEDIVAGVTQAQYLVGELKDLASNVYLLHERIIVCCGASTGGPIKCPTCARQTRCFRAGGPPFFFGLSVQITHQLFGEVPLSFKNWHVTYARNVGALQ